MHRAQFTQLILDFDHAALLVVIEQWMGADLRARTTAEDLWQETLAAAWRDHEKHEFRDPASFRGYLLQIARHRLLDAVDVHKAQKRGGGAASLSIDETGILAALPVASTTPSRVAMYRERADAMRSALASLPPELGTLVRGHHFEQRPMTEVAAALGIPLATAWSRFRRGLELYAKALHGSRRTEST